MKKFLFFSIVAFLLATGTAKAQLNAAEVAYEINYVDPNSGDARFPGLYAAVSGNTVTVTGTSRDEPFHPQDVGHQQFQHFSNVSPEVTLIWQATHDGNVNWGSTGGATFVMQSGRIGDGLNIFGSVNLIMTGGTLTKLYSWMGALRMYSSGVADISGGTISSSIGYGIESVQTSGGKIIISGNTQVSGIDNAILSMGNDVEIAGGTITCTATSYYAVTGVSAANNRLKMTGGTVTVTQDGSNKVDGITGKKVEFSGGSVIVTNNTGGVCRGIVGGDSLTITGGQVTVTNNGNSETHGVEGTNYVTIGGGNVSVTSAAAANTYGIVCNGAELKMTDGTVTASGGSAIYGFYSRYLVNISGGSIAASGTNSYGGIYQGNSYTTSIAKITGGTVSGNTGLKVAGYYGKTAFLTGTVQGVLDVTSDPNIFCAEVSTLSIPYSWDGTSTGLTQHSVNEKQLAPVWDLSGSVPLIKFTNNSVPSNPTVYTVEWGESITTGIAEITKDALRILIDNGELKIENYAGGAVAVYDIAGRNVGAKNFSPLRNGAQTIDISPLPSGVYIVKAGNKTGKFVKE
ncbi:MAG: T9SS type A sorting domain-containing protein [Prevotellaceae bacterium]|jgi:hypothetical protein|nr:T9SS type A sorting domain-containing protein [Prevotellaceae bacterium]